MRLPRLLLAGLLLFAAVLLLTALFARPSLTAAGAVAVAVFAPMWLTIAVTNAALGVYSAGYRPREEATVLLPVFGVPASIAAVVGWWAGDLHVSTSRFPVLMAAGLALWLAVALLGALLLPGATAARALRFAAAVFAPLWTLLMVINLLIGVLAAGYSVAEELPVLLLNAIPPIAVAGAATAVAKRRRAPAAASDQS